MELAKVLRALSTSTLLTLETLMKIAVLLICVLTLLISCANTRNSTVDREVQISMDTAVRLTGAWILKIENLQHQVITTMTIHFTNIQANSCLGGNWKQIIVESHNKPGVQFFPVDQPLSYKLDKNKLVIGRNEICDAYLHLNGDLTDSKASGEYIEFGWTSKRIGYFSLTRSDH